MYVGLSAYGNVVIVLPGVRDYAHYFIGQTTDHSRVSADMHDEARPRARTHPPRSMYIVRPQYE